MKHFFLPLLLIFCFLSAKPQSPVDVVKTSVPPVIDGILDDEAWSTALTYSDFKSYMPEFSKPVSFETHVMLTYDEENIFVAFDCRDPEPDKIKATIAARDNIKSEDWVCINMDPFFDQQSMVDLYMNPFGIQEDGRSSGNSEDTGADYVFYSKGTIDAEGYKVEIQIPFKSLRYRKKEPVIMGFIMERRIQRLSEHSTCPGLSEEQGMNFRVQTKPFSFTGIKHYTLLEGIPALTYTRQKEQDQGSLALKTNKPSVSFTGKVGLTSQLVLDVAVNPDFSQVESDAGQIEENQRYALYYPEKRPFFQEGKENFDIAGISSYSYFRQAFHTRQVVNPLAGIKLTGKLNHKNRIAFLYALDEPFEDTDSAAVRSSYIVGRHRYTLKEDSYLGVIATFREGRDTWNRVAGLDGLIRLNPSSTAEFNLLGSSSLLPSGDPEKNDWMGTALLKKQNSKITATLELQHIGQNFMSESGYLIRSGLNRIYGTATYNLYRGSGFIRKYSPFIFGMNNYELTSRLWEIDDGVGVSLSGDRSTRIKLFVNPCNEVYRSGSFKTHNVHISASSQVLKSLMIMSDYRFGYLTRYVENPFTGYGSTGSISLSFQPVQKFQSELSINYSDFYHLKTRHQDFRYGIIRSKNIYQINSKLFVRAIVEYNTFEKDLTLDLLASFTYIPGTVVHLGYGSLFRQTEWNGHDYQPGSDFLVVKRGLFFKASYLFRN